MTVPGTSTGGLNRSIPLTPYLKSLLQNLKSLNDRQPLERQINTLAARGESWKSSKWVFSSETAVGGKLPNFGSLITGRSRKQSLHTRPCTAFGDGLGRSSNGVEVPSGVSAQIMGHKPGALAEKRYRRRPLDMLRQWHDQIEACMLTQAQVEFCPDGQLVYPHQQAQQQLVMYASTF